MSFALYFFPFWLPIDVFFNYKHVNAIGECEWKFLENNSMVIISQFSLVFYLWSITTEAFSHFYIDDIKIYDAIIHDFDLVVLRVSLNFLIVLHWRDPNRIIDSQLHI